MCETKNPAEIDRIFSNLILTWIKLFHHDTAGPSQYSEQIIKCADSQVEN
ncbi:MAG: hypothetical protein PHX02_04075 [Oscillospiraceae bacterium]|nr:hypothetical protein [Oscillospiraceae bacterium]